MNPTEDNHHKPFLIGITGGIGGGKSTVCDMLRARGAEVFVADDVAKDIMQNDPGVTDEIRSAFGNESYGEDGFLDRAYLSSAIFSSRENLETINNIVHPRVRAAFIKAAAQTRSDVLVLESALLIGSPYLGLLDAVIVVEAPESDRIERVVARDQTTNADVAARVARQDSIDSYRNIATFVLVNDGTIEQLEKGVDEMLESLPISL